MFYVLNDKTLGGLFAVDGMVVRFASVAEASEAAEVLNDELETDFTVQPGLYVASSPRQSVAL